MRIFSSLLPSASLLLAGLAPFAARAEVVAAEETAFTTRTQVTIAAPAARVYEALLQVGRWWSDAHTYSGAAQRMTLEARPGGCWCERLDDGGFIEHGRVVYAATGRTLRMSSALGPLHEVGGAGSLNLQLDADGTGTRLTLTYVATGFEPQKGLAPMAPLFDGVLTEQMQRLKHYVEKGKAVAKARGG